MLNYSDNNWNLMLVLDIEALCGIICPTKLTELNTRVQVLICEID